MRIVKQSRPPTYVSRVYGARGRGSSLLLSSPERDIDSDRCQRRPGVRLLFRRQASCRVVFSAAPRPRRRENLRVVISRHDSRTRDCCTRLGISLGLLCYGGRSRLYLSIAARTNQTSLDSTVTRQEVPRRDDGPLRSLRGNHSSPQASEPLAWASFVLLHHAHGPLRVIDVTTGESKASATLTTQTANTSSFAVSDDGTQVVCVTNETHVRVALAQHNCAL